MTAPTNPYESPAGHDATREFSTGWTSIWIHRGIRWPVALFGLMFQAVALLMVLLVMGSMLNRVVGQIGNVVMVAPLPVAGYALLSGGKRMLLRYDRIPARCPKFIGCSYRTGFWQRRYRCVHCGHEQ